jgi:hypothetical protein
MKKIFSFIALLFAASNMMASLQLAQNDTIKLLWSSETSAKVDWYDYCDKEGWWQMEAKDSAYFITLSNDTYVSVASGSYKVSDLLPDYSYIIAYADHDSITFADGTLTVEEDAKGDVTIRGTLLANNGNTYEITIIYSWNLYKYDEDADFIVDYDSYTLDDKFAELYDCVDVIGSNEANQYIYLDFSLPVKVGKLLPGKYTIDDSRTPMTVHAGNYDNETGYYIKSLAAVKDEEGLKKVWYLVSGTVTVDDQLNIYVEAKNSLGRDIKVNMKSSYTQGLEAANTTRSAHKSIENGHLLIERNDTRYNAVGTRMR